MDTKFNIEEVEKTITTYKKNQLAKGIVVSIKDDGLVFNLGGKLDAFVPKNEAEDFSNSKIGDRFSVLVTGNRTEDGMIEVSQKKANQIKLETQNAKEIKLGAAFPIIISKCLNDGSLASTMGEYEIVIPENEICSYKSVNPRSFVGKKVMAIATEISSEEKKIKASIRILEDKTRAANEEVFWQTNFINKIVDGTVKRFVPYGAFVDVGGVSCLLHISNISNSKINSAADVLELGKTYKFKILSLDRENKKVSLGLKQLEQKK